MSRPEWAPPEQADEAVDLDHPSEARMYDYLLGGWHNFAVDRKTARAMISIAPDTPLHAQANRAFVRRAVRYLVDRGIRQFLDLGSGILTAGNVHEIAQGAARDARVVYVDVDPLAVAYGRDLLADNPNAILLPEDIRQPWRVLQHPETQRLLSLERPVAVLLVAVLHLLPDEHAYLVVDALRDALAPGSYLVLSHANVSQVAQAHREVSEKVYDRTGHHFVPRTTTEIARFFEGFTLVEPGLVWVSQWRPAPGAPGPAPEKSTMLGGVGRRD